MISEAPTNKNPLPVPSWVGVRIIYKKLSEEFSVLTSTFNIDINQKTKLDLDHLIIAIDEIDTCIDELPTKEERDSITDSLIDYLNNEQDQWNHPNETPTLSIKIKNLKQVVHQLKIEEDFIGAAKTIFLNTELKRHTKKLSELIQYVTIEGKATAILPLSIMNIKTDTPFGKFFTALCMLMGIADLIMDARQDFKQGLIIFKPSFGLYIKLFKIAIKDGVGLLFSIPRKIRFMKYCFRFALALLKG